MKNNFPINPPETKKTANSRLFSEKFLLIFFAGLSLALVLGYTFFQTATQASPADSAPLTPPPSAANEAQSPATAADVVQKALAFKALLTAAQQATLEKTYTAQLARRWSNLPCGSNCRNVFNSAL